jgi:hypothetical protein
VQDLCRVPPQWKRNEFLQDLARPPVLTPRRSAAALFPSMRCEHILALNIEGAVFPEGLDAFSGYLPALIEINASAVHPQLQRLN